MIELEGAGEREATNVAGNCADDGKSSATVPNNGGFDFLRKNLEYGEVATQKTLHSDPISRYNHPDYVSPWPFCEPSMKRYTHVSSLALVSTASTAT